MPQVDPDQAVTVDLDESGMDSPGHPSVRRNGFTPGAELQDTAAAGDAFATGPESGGVRADRSSQGVAGVVVAEIVLPAAAMEKVRRCSLAPTPKSQGSWSMVCADAGSL